MTISIDLGSGPHPRNTLNADNVIGLDTFEQADPEVIKWDLMSGTLPFGTSSIDFVTAFDFIEHLDRVGFRLNEGKLERYSPYIDMMSEIWRVLKPGGQLYAFTPVFPNTNEVFRDPTHTNPITPDTWEYWAGSMLPLTQHYGFKGEFKQVRQQVFEGAHVIWHWEAIK